MTENIENEKIIFGIGQKIEDCKDTLMSQWPNARIEYSGNTYPKASNEQIRIIVGENGIIENVGVGPWEETIKSKNLNDLSEKKKITNITDYHNFNDLTPAETERLSILMEECSEVIQVVGKILRHGYECTHPNGGPTNRELLEEELGHAWFAQEMLIRNHDVKAGALLIHLKSKSARIQQYLHHNIALNLHENKYD